MSVVEASEPTDFSADPSQEQDPVATERDALDHEGPPGLGAEASDPIGITDPSSNPDPVAPVEEAPVAETAADWFDEDAQKRAEFYGLDVDAARSYGSREALERTFTALDRQARAWADATGQQYETQEQPEQAHQAQQPQQAQLQQSQQQVQQAQQQLQAAIEKYKLELDPESYDQDTLKTFNGLNDHYHKVLTDIQARNEQYIRALAERQYGTEAAVHQYTSQLQAEESARNEREMDTFFANAGEPLKELFGASKTAQLAEKSDLRGARETLWKEMLKQWQVDAQFNRPKLSVPEMAQRVANALHGEKIVSHAKTTARKEILNETKARQQTQIARPAGSQPKPKTGVDAAKKFVSAHPLMRSVREGSF
jgi:hypothetical protein